MEIFINKRFNGPPNSGNGGYVAGLIAKEIGKCCEVKLVAPPPVSYTHLTLPPNREV